VAGTTNEDEILLDPTGYRRYWPVRVEKAKLAWIYDHRNQLFAEALALYNQGAVWWFDEGSEEGERLRRYTMPYQQVHPWTEVIYDWIAQHAGDKAFTVGQVLQRALGRLTSDLTQHEAALVGTILRHHIGCSSERSMVGGRKVTMYHRPPNMVLPNSKKNNLIALSRQHP
jgi:putative DNA primase/helicase